VNLAITTCRRLPVPIPPLSEQAAACEVAMRALSNVDAAAVTVRALALRATALRQSVLKSAFCGELVAQDPTGESSAALLERIVDERAATGRGRNTKEAA